MRRLAVPPRGVAVRPRAGAVIRLSRAALALLALSGPAAAQHASGAQAAEIGGLRRVIGFDIGQRNVKALMIDGSDVWLGTSEGLVRYDTQTGDHRLYDNTSGLLSNGVFHVSRVGAEIWVGTYGGGLALLEPVAGTWRRFNIPEGLGDAFVYDALTDTRGDVWIATWSGVNQVIGGALDDPSAWRLHTVESTGGGLPNDWVYALAEGAPGEIWLATEGGLARLQHGWWAHWSHADGLGAPLEAVAGGPGYNSDPGAYSEHHARQKQAQGLGDVTVAYNPNYVVALAVDAEGVVWAGTWGAGLARFDGARWRNYTHADGLPGDHVFALRTDLDGRLWIGANHGLALWDGARLTTFDRRDGLRSETVFAIDSAEGAVWAAGFGGVTWLPHGLEGLGRITEGAIR